MVDTLGEVNIQNTGANSLVWLKHLAYIQKIGGSSPSSLTKSLLHRLGLNWCFKSPYKIMSEHWIHQPSLLKYLGTTVESGQYYKKNLISVSSYV